MRKFKAQFDKRPVSNEAFPCDQVLPGDGIDPRLEKHEHRKVANRKALQLCAQVMDSLNLTLSTLGNDSLRGLYVEAVVPAPDSSQLLVTVVPTDTNDCKKVLEELLGASGKLRSEIAASINRKRVPQLKFTFSSASI
jgi:ribosome-binding factor A